MAQWPPQWTKEQLFALAKYVMVTASPYGDYPSSARAEWPMESLHDNQSQLWTFRGTPTRVERAVLIPYSVRYPTVKEPKLGNPLDWSTYDTKEHLLIGYVGSGGH